MKDEKLDKIFIEAAEGVNFRNPESSWINVKSKLENPLGPKVSTSNSFKEWIKRFLVLFIVLTSSILLWNYGGDLPFKSLFSSTNTPVTEKNVPPNISSIDTGQENSTNSENGINEIPGLTGKKQRETESHSSQTSQRQNAQNSQGKAEISTNNDSNGLRSSISQSREPNIAREKQSAENMLPQLANEDDTTPYSSFEGQMPSPISPKEEGNETSLGDPSQPNKKNRYSNTVANGEASNKALELFGAKEKKSFDHIPKLPFAFFHIDINEPIVKEVPEKSISTPSLEEEDDDENETQRSPWSFGLEFSPDLSGTSLNQIDDTGFNLGLNVEYFVNNRLSISSGIAYAKKVYFTDENLSDYPGANPNWKIGRVNAVCDVIDIPLNATYYLKERNKSGLFISMGLSTYLMLTEDYDIVYDGPWENASWFVKNQNQHYFGLVNASFGYKKSLSSTTSIQAEPFLKLPIQGIGECNLSLLTSGLRLTLKFSRIK